MDINKYRLDDKENTDSLNIGPGSYDPRMQDNIKTTKIMPKLTRSLIKAPAKKYFIDMLSLTEESLSTHSTISLVNCDRSLVHSAELSVLDCSTEARTMFLHLGSITLALLIRSTSNIKATRSREKRRSSMD